MCDSVFTDLVRVPNIKFWVSKSGTICQVSLGKSTRTLRRFLPIPCHHLCTSQLNPRVLKPPVFYCHRKSLSRKRYELYLCLKCFWVLDNLAYIILHLSLRIKQSTSTLMMAAITRFYLLTLKHLGSPLKIIYIDNCSWRSLKPAIHDMSTLVSANTMLNRLYHMQLTSTFVLEYYKPSVKQ